MSYRSGASTLLLLACVLGAAPAAAQSDGELRAPAITGRLTFFGCTPAASDFTLWAAPLTADGGHRDDTRDERAQRLTDEVPELPAVQRGSLEATTDPRVFHFSVSGVEADLAYQLRIAPNGGDSRVPPNPVLPCGRVFWEGPEQGIVFPGVPVSLRGYAPRSSIEVMGTQPKGAIRRGWVGAESVDLQDPKSATRQFRWFTNVAGVTAALVQVSTERFPKEDVAGRSCVAVPGVIYQQTVAARTGAWNMLPSLNLAAIAASVALSGRSGLQQYELFAYGAPLYVRVVPVTGRTFRCSAEEHGPMPWVIVANAAKSLSTNVNLANNQLPPPPTPIFLTDKSHYTPPWFFGHPGQGETLYRVVKPHTIPSDIFQNFPSGFFTDPFAYQIAKWTPLNPGDTIPEDYFFWFKPGSGFDIGDVFEGAVSIVTGVVDAVGLLVDQVSKAYESIKAAVAKVAMSAISATGLVDCEKSDACRMLVETAINSGLAAAGMPPSLPNWNAVVDQGFEYFAAEVVSQAGLSSVPGATELTKQAAQALVEETMTKIKEGRGGGGSLPPYLMVDIGQQPAILTMELGTLGSTTAPLFPTYLRLFQTPALMGEGVGLPKAWRDENGTKFMKIPIVMRPNLAGFEVPKLAGSNLPDYTVGLFAKQWWQERLATIPCVVVFNQLLFKLGFVTMPSSYVVTSIVDFGPQLWVGFNPTTESWFPPYMHCTP